MRLPFFLLLLASSLAAQTSLTIHPEVTTGPAIPMLQPSVFFVPKTAIALDDFLEAAPQQNTLRTNVLESVLNNARNQEECLQLLASVKDSLVRLSDKTDRLLFIFEKMPPWLSSSSDGSPSASPGYSVLNTRPPRDWAAWEAIVGALTNSIVNDFGIQNAWFEVWNEPDIGSWTGSSASYFELYRRTYDAVKAVAPSAPVGGPAVNGWANDLDGSQPPYGHVTPAQFNSTLIATLLDSCAAWERPPNFISWHQFNPTHQNFALAEGLILGKLSQLNLPETPILVSEWNAPNAWRDGAFQRSLIVKNLMEMATTDISGQAIAAWQDFDEADVEFHQDFGLLTYGGIRKPAHAAMRMVGRLKGQTVQVEDATELVNVMATVEEDSIHIVLVNYAPLPFLEAFNHTLFEHQLNVDDLEAAGYIINGVPATYLDSVFQNLSPLRGDQPTDQAVGEGRRVYAHFDSLQRRNQRFQLSIAGQQGTTSAIVTRLNDTVNNQQFRFEQLRLQNESRAEAVALLSSQSQALHSETITFPVEGMALSLAPNEVISIKLVKPRPNATTFESRQQALRIYPNPAHEVVIVELPNSGPQLLTIYNDLGQQVTSLKVRGPQVRVMTESLPPGWYRIVVSGRTYFGGSFVKH